VGGLHLREGGATVLSDRVTWQGNGFVYVMQPPVTQYSTRDRTNPDCLGRQAAEAGGTLVVGQDGEAVLERVVQVGAGSMAVI
jgi:hypothetical protein